MKALPLLLLPLALLLNACKREHSAPSTFSPDAAAEYLQLCERVESSAGQTLDSLDKDKPFFGKEEQVNAQIRRMAEETLELLRNTERSGDATLTTPMVQQTLLHLAVQHRMEALVRDLLRLGADPNALCDLGFMGRGKMDAPLAWVAVPELTEGELKEKPFAETAIRLVDALAAAGARLNGEAGGQALLLSAICGPEEAEELFLHLLECGANPSCGYIPNDQSSATTPHEYLQDMAAFVLRRRWARALHQLMVMGHLSADWRMRDRKTLLFCVLEQQQVCSRSTCPDDSSPEEYAADVSRLSESSMELVRVLLEHGADPNAPQGGGWTPMAYAACMGANHGAAAPAWKGIRTLLLEHGGDRNSTVPAHHGKPARSVSEWLAEPQP